MITLLIVITIIFAFSAFLANLQLVSGGNPFLNFLFFQGNFMLSHLAFFLVVFIIAAIVLLKIIKFEKTHRIHRKFAIFSIQIGAIFFIGIFLSYVFLLCVALIQLNVYAIIIDRNPASLGIISDQKTIVKALRQSNDPVQIIASDTDESKALVAIATATTGADNFYGSSILSAVPSFLLLPMKNLPPSLLIDNTLVITQINKKNLQTLSPLIGYMFIKHYFPLREIKYYPKISIMDENAYKEYRSQDLKEKIGVLSNQVTNDENFIATTSAAIAKQQNTIAADKDAITKIYAEKDSQMNSCVNKGLYDNSGNFVKTYTQTFCEEQFSFLDTQVNYLNQEIDNLTQKIPQEKKDVATYTTYDEFFKNQIQIANSFSNNIPHELGVFKPPDTIRIVIDNKSPHAIADYFATVAHEYFHYASHTETAALSSLFFEEGLTEYFARQAVADNLNIETDLGYPVNVKIIAQMAKSIPETDLADIYFTKDEAKLEDTLNSVYGNNFYQNNILLFTTLQYALDQNQELTIANTIMKEIGGTPLTPQDLISTTSNF